MDPRRASSIFDQRKSIPFPLRLAGLLLLAGMLAGVGAGCGGGRNQPAASPAQEGPASQPLATASPARNLESSTPIAGPFLPDLTIGEAALALESARGCVPSGAALILSLEVGNVGKGAAGPFQVQIDGQRRRVPGLDPGQSVLLEVEVASQRVRVVVDPEGEVDERYEGNNERTMELSLPTPPPPCPTATPSATPGPLTSPGAPDEIFLSGQVIEAGSGLGVEGVEIYLSYSLSGGNPVVRVVAVTDSEGRYHSGPIAVPSMIEVRVWPALEGWRFDPSQVGWRHQQGYDPQRFDFTARR